MRNYLGMCLFSQGGVAVGLAIIATHRFATPVKGSTIVPGEIIVVVIIVTTFVVEILGPPMVKLGVKKAGEIGLDVTEEDLIRSYTVGALPILNHFLDRMKLEEVLQAYLPAEDRRTKVPTARGLVLLVKNILVSREPIYGLGEWAARYAPDLLGLEPEQVLAINDDRAGRWLGKFFACGPTSPAVAEAAHAVEEFGLSLDELHNDSTTVTFYGAYADAAEEKRRQGRNTLAITFGHNKDHRPDLKQLLYILTLSEDGGVPVHFHAASGNVVDDQTHRHTWQTLHKGLAALYALSRPDFCIIEGLTATPHGHFPPTILLEEANQLVAITVSSIKTARSNK